MPIYYATIPLILNVGLRADQPLATDVGEGTLYSVSDEAYLIEQSDGAAWVQWGPTPNGSSAAAIQAVSVSLTDAQIKALPTTPFTLVAAPGSGLRVKLIAATAFINNHAGVYTGVNTTYASLQIETSDGSWLSAIANDTTDATDVTAFFNTDHNPATPGGGGVLDWPVPPQFPSGGWLIQIMTTGRADVENKAIRLAMDNNGSGNLGGGNAANTLSVTVYYALETI